MRTTHGNRSPISPDGRRHLEAEIAHLKRNVRPGIARAISDTARAHGMGDISAAKRQLVDFDARISQLEQRLGETVVVDPCRPPDRNRVHFGARVTCLTEDGEERVMVLLGAEEADPRQNRISWNAPVARALAGARVGDEVQVRTPKGELSLELTGISYSGG